MAGAEFSQSIAEAVHEADESAHWLLTASEVPSQCRENAAGKINDLTALAHLFVRDMKRLERDARKQIREAAEANAYLQRKRASEEAKASKARAEQQAWRDRVARARLAAEQNGLRLQDTGDGRDEFLLLAVRGSRFAPSRWSQRSVPAVVTSGQTVFEVPGAHGSLRTVEAWLADHVGFRP